MKRLVLFYTLGITIFSFNASAQNFPFEVLDLNNFIASADSAQAINNNNQVLLGNTDGSLSVYDANNAGVFNLNPDPGYYFADNAGINDYGQIAASQCAFSTGACKSVFYDPNYGFYDINPYGQNSYVNDINNAGYVIGSYYDGYGYSPYVYNPYYGYDYFGGTSNGFGDLSFNDFGQIVGYGGYNNYYAPIYYDGYGDYFSEAYNNFNRYYPVDINNSGQVLGYDQYGYTYVYDNTGGYYPIDYNGYNVDPYAINDYGSVVGTYYQGNTNQGHAYYYDDNYGNVDLTCLLPAEADVQLATATDINNHGYIIGDTNQGDPYLFIPHNQSAFHSSNNYCVQVQFYVDTSCRKRSKSTIRREQSKPLPKDLKCKVSVQASDTQGNYIPRSRFQLQIQVGNSWQTISTKKTNKKGKVSFSSLTLSSKGKYRVYGPIDYLPVPAGAQTVYHNQ